MPKKPQRPTIQELQNALELPRHKSPELWSVFEAYCHHTPEPGELPILIKALRHEDIAIVRAAAQSIAKLGPAVADSAVMPLYRAGGFVDPSFGLPQAYSECLDALVAVGADEKVVIELVHSHFGHRDWSIVRDSMHALKKLATPKSLNLLSRIIVFWWPDLNTKEQRYVQSHFPEFAPK